MAVGAPVKTMPKGGVYFSKKGKQRFTRKGWNEAVECVSCSVGRGASVLAFGEGSGCIFTD
jgi:hypothetical protein